MSCSSKQCKSHVESADIHPIEVKYCMDWQLTASDSQHEILGHMSLVIVIGTSRDMMQL